jgi:zinc transporter 1/2/3
MIADLLSIKIALLVVVGFATYLASLTPWVAARYLASRRALDLISLGSSLSSGIVFGTLLCHMLPGSTESFSKYLSSIFKDEADSKIVEFPFAGVICGIVFTFLVSIDALIVRKGLDGNDLSGAGDGEEDHNHSGHGHDHITTSLRKFAAAAEESDHLLKKKVSLGQMSPTRAVTSPRAISIKNDDDTSSSTMPVLPIDHGNILSNQPIVITPEEKRRLVMRAWVFFFALSLHGVFDGLSVASETDPTAFTSILFAVVSHKLFDGLALGVALYPAPLSDRQRHILLFLSALSTPIGIALGIGATQLASSDNLSLVDAIALSLASGSFCYISLMELLPSSLSDGRRVPEKLSLFFFGFTVMSAIAYFV